MSHLTRTNKIAKDLRTAKYRQRIEDLEPHKQQSRKKVKYDRLIEEAYEYIKEREDSES